MKYVSERSWYSAAKKESKALMSLEPNGIAIPSELVKVTGFGWI